MKHLLGLSCIFVIGLSACSTTSVADYTGQTCESLRSLTRSYENSQMLDASLSYRPPAPIYDRKGRQVDPARHDERDDTIQERNEQLSAIRAAYKANGCNR